MEINFMFNSVLLWWNRKLFVCICFNFPYLWNFYFIHMVIQKGVCNFVIFFFCFVLFAVVIVLKLNDVVIIKSRSFLNFFVCIIINLVVDWFIESDQSEVSRRIETIFRCFNLAQQSLTRPLRYKIALRTLWII